MQLSERPGSRLRRGGPAQPPPKPGGGHGGPSTQPSQGQPSQSQRRAKANPAKANPAKASPAKASPAKGTRPPRHPRRPRRSGQPEQPKRWPPTRLRFGQGDPIRPMGRGRPGPRDLPATVASDRRDRPLQPPPAAGLGALAGPGPTGCAPVLPSRTRARPPGPASARWRSTAGCSTGAPRRCSSWPSGCSRAGAGRDAAPRPGGHASAAARGWPGWPCRSAPMST